MRFSHLVSSLVLVLAFSTAICAQQQANEATAVPRLIRFNGSYHHSDQQTQTAVLGAAGATFSIYRGQYDRTPLWTEIQNIQPDKDGSYSVLIGSTRNDGIPVDLFTTAEQRWLEVEIDQIKQPRMLLGSVPYALKSIDADTLGGLPPSAYLRVNSPGFTASTNNARAFVAANLPPLANIGVPNCIGMFSNTTDLICSTINQDIYAGNPAVSIGGTADLGALTLIGIVPFGDAAGMALYNEGGGAGASVSLDMYNTQSNGGIPQAKIKAIDDGNYSDNLTFWSKVPGGPNNPVTEKFRITSTGSVGIGTANPTQKLEVAGAAKFDGGVVFGDGTTQTTATLIGPQGPSGLTGSTGPQGAAGAAGTAATIGIGTTTTGASGTPASVSNSGTTTAAMLNFTIPQGQPGATGSTGPQGPAGTTGTAGPQGPTGPQGPQGSAGSGGVTVLDANNNVLGSLAGFPTIVYQSASLPGSVWVFKNGHFINIDFSGKFQVAGLLAVIFWSGTNCSGTAYLNGGQFVSSSNFVIYSNQANSFYVISGNGVVPPVSLSEASYESPGNGGGSNPPDGVSYCTNYPGGPITNTGFLLSPFNASAVLGWGLSGNPLSVAGPIKFQ